MMKKLLLFLAIPLLTISLSKAQSSFELSWNGVPVADTTLIYDHADSSHTMHLYASVKNVSDKSVNVKVARTNIDVLADSYNSICFAYFCYGSPTDTSDYITIGAGQISDSAGSLKTDYGYTEGAVGQSVVKYSFFNVEDTTDRKSTL